MERPSVKSCSPSERAVTESLERMTRDLVNQAYEGDSEALRVLVGAVKFQKALEQIFNTYELRTALVLIGKHYGGAQWEELCQAFKTNRMDLWRAGQNLQRNGQQ